MVRKLEGHSLQDGGSDAPAPSPDKATVSPSSKGIASPSGSSKTRFGNQPQLGSSFEQGEDFIDLENLRRRFIQIKIKVSVLESIWIKIFFTNR